MFVKRLAKILPAWQSAALAVAAAVMLALSFPDFDLWPLAFVAFIPLFAAIAREKDSLPAAFISGWIFGTVFFSLTCWWLTFAPITYAGFPVWLAYLLLLVASAGAGIFSALFGMLQALAVRRLGRLAMLAAPFFWVFTEFLRYWLTGNNWNAVGYSQAFGSPVVNYSAIGGISLVSWHVLMGNVFIVAIFYISTLVQVRLVKRFFSNVASIDRGETPESLETVEPPSRSHFQFLIGTAILLFLVNLFSSLVGLSPKSSESSEISSSAIIAIQPNVPMAGLSYQKWQQLRQRHVELAESALKNIDRQTTPYVTVIFPESPMNFMYDEEAETQTFINGFARRNNVNILFNSAEPDKASGKYFNSAVMVSPQGEELVQYDKIFLVPFGESVPAPLQPIVPALVGSFAYGSEYDLFPLGGEGNAQAGVMICFESHFGQLGREFVLRGADVLIEMTNDGYLGPTPILRQHLANAVVRAIETNRPVLRVTNVGITAYINEKGQVIAPAPVYQEDTRIWQVTKSDGSQTFYVRYGDWFAWLCILITVLFIGSYFFRGSDKPDYPTN